MANIIRQGGANNLDADEAPDNTTTAATESVQLNLTGGFMAYIHLALIRAT